MAEKPECNCGSHKAKSEDDSPVKPLGEENLNVYCTGKLLEAVQLSNMFPDCKTFVDMKMRYPADRILGDFDMFCNCKKNDGSVKFLEMFVEQHFEPQGSELEKWSPPDWKANPKFLSQISDAELKKFGSDLNKLWKDLGKRMNDDVKENPELYSIVYVPNPIIVPGGRFMEFYYWDSYWIIRGLLYCEMQKTARGMIENFLSLVERYGFVPNGGRIYYSGRSQPPLLIPMVKSYVEFTNDEKFAVDALPLLEKEFENYLKLHSVEVKGHTMYTYRDRTYGPRPESYREDVESAGSFCSDEEKEQHYSELKAACESGMDFSSRWFISESGTNEGALKDTRTTSIVPVDLNAMLFRNAKILAEFHGNAGNAEKANEYQVKANKIQKAIKEVMWNECSGIWLDYDMTNKKSRNYYVVSNLTPLWLKAYNISDSDKVSESVLKYIKSNKLDSYPGGLPTTLNNTGQQWDYPNVWPPHMYMVIEGLQNLGTPEAQELSKSWAHRWVKSNYATYKEKGVMFEKYNCEQIGQSGGGGEYEMQKGFGWTNGIIIELLAKHGQDLTAGDDANGGSTKCSCKKGGPSTAAMTHTGYSSIKQCDRQ